VLTARTAAWPIEADPFAPLFLWLSVSPAETVNINSTTIVIALILFFFLRCCGEPTAFPQHYAEWCTLLRRQLPKAKKPSRPDDWRPRHDSRRTFGREKRKEKATMLHVFISLHPALHVFSLSRFHLPVSHDSKKSRKLQPDRTLESNSNSPFPYIHTYYIHTHR